MPATQTIKCHFPNAQDQQLEARLDLPGEQPPRAYAVLSHCFTCSKDTITAFRISRGLAAMGLGVLRFDFTGLGDSEGAFADTNFTTMIQDILSAARFLQQHYAAPVCLIGHSMGGTAALLASRSLDSCRSVITLASPSEPAHVLHHFGPVMGQLNAGEPASINVAGQDFPVKPQFIDDVQSVDMRLEMAGYDKAILAVRAGRDQLVAARDAEDIIAMSSGTTQLLDIDAADHLFTDREHTRRVVEQIAAFIKTR